TVDLHLRACPFIELVHRHREAMCGLHHGVIQGVLESAGADGQPVRSGRTRDGGDVAAGGAGAGDGTRAADGAGAGDSARAGGGTGANDGTRVGTGAADVVGAGFTGAGGDSRPRPAMGDPVLVPFATPDACVVRLAAPRRP